MKKEYSFCVDSRLQITVWDDDISALTGRKTQKAVGKKYYAVFPPLLSGAQEAVSAVIARKRKVTIKRYPFQCLTNSLSNVSADVTIHPLKLARGAAGAKIVVSNLTSCASLQFLQNSQRMIEIGKKASTLAHSVRNPLNALKGAVVYLSEKYAKEPALAEFSKIMREEITRLEQYISKFLSSPFQEGELSLTDINGLVKKIQLYSSYQIRTHDIDADFEYGDIPLVVGSSFQIEQAILNVLNNAVDAMRKGGKLIVRTYTVEREGAPNVVIQVSDTGGGMAWAKLNSLQPGGGKKGKGFGLFLTRDILQNCHGHLEIDSEEGKGTTIRMYIPVSSIDQPAGRDA